MGHGQEHRHREKDETRSSTPIGDTPHLHAPIGRATPQTSLTPWNLPIQGRCSTTFPGDGRPGVRESCTSGCHLLQLHQLWIVLLHPPQSSGPPHQWVSPWCGSLMGYHSNMWLIGGKLLYWDGGEGYRGHLLV